MNRKIKCAIGVIGIFILVLCIYWGNTSIQSTYITVESKHLPQYLDGFSIVQVSDLHNTSFGKEQVRLIQAIKEVQPDIILVTGDLIDSYHTDIDIALEFICKAVEIAPVYYVTGNHEARVREAFSALKKQMLQIGVVVLDDEGIILDYQDEGIQLLGLNDPLFGKTDYRVTDAKYMDNILRKMDISQEAYTILLSHRPELFGTYVNHGIDLTFTGHAHGGQIRIPFLGGILAPHQGFFPQYSSGLYSEGSSQMIVSRGLGNSLFPLRINNRPELVVARLKTKE